MGSLAHPPGRPCARLARSEPEINHKELMMLQIIADGCLSWSCIGPDSFGQTSATIELPSEMVEQQCDLIDRVVSFAFDTLGLQSIELRIRPTAEAGS
jgi:hypothetical protein